MPMQGAVARSRSRTPELAHPPNSPPDTGLPTVSPSPSPSPPAISETQSRHDPSPSDAIFAILPNGSIIQAVDLTDASDASSSLANKRKRNGDPEGGRTASGQEPSPSKRRRNEIRSIPPRVTRSAARRAELIAEASAEHAHLNGKDVTLVHSASEGRVDGNHAAPKDTSEQMAVEVEHPTHQLLVKPATTSTKTVNHLSQADRPVRYSAGDGWYVRFRDQPSSPLAPNYVRKHRELSLQQIWASDFAKPPSLDRISLLKSRAISVQLQTRQWFPRGFPQIRIPSVKLPPQARFCKPPVPSNHSEMTPLTPELVAPMSPYEHTPMDFSDHPEFTSSSSNTIQLDPDLEVPITWEQPKSHQFLNHEVKNGFDYSLESYPIIPASAGLDSFYWYMPSSHLEDLNAGFMQQNYQVGQGLLEPQQEHLLPFTLSSKYPIFDDDDSRC